MTAQQLGLKLPSPIDVDLVATPLGWHLEDLSDFEFRLVVPGRPFVLKNSKLVTFFVKLASFIKGRGHRCPKCKAPLQIIPKVLPSKQAKAYLEAATKELAAQWSAVFREPLPGHVLCNAAIVTYRATLHRNDASNLYEAPQDAMQAAGVLTDDFQIASHDGSRRLHDPKNPRVEITLTPYVE